MESGTTGSHLLPITTPKELTTPKDCNFGAGGGRLGVRKAREGAGLWWRGGDWCCSKPQWIPQPGARVCSAAWQGDQVTTGGSTRLAGACEGAAGPVGTAG